jgi:hypothetical protein
LLNSSARKAEKMSREPSLRNVFSRYSPSSASTLEHSPLGRDLIGALTCGRRSGGRTSSSTCALVTHAQAAGAGGYPFPPRLRTRWASPWSASLPAAPAFFRGSDRRGWPWLVGGAGRRRPPTPRLRTSQGRFILSLLRAAPSFMARNLARMSGATQIRRLPCSSSLSTPTARARR